MEYQNKKGEISSVLAWDDLTNMRLDAGKVKEARSKEVGYIRDKRVYDKIPRAQALRNKWNVVQVRWIDINKGDDENPNYRSRLVGKEFNHEPKEGLFAGTPPLAAPISSTEGGAYNPPIDVALQPTIATPDAEATEASTA